MTVDEELLGTDEDAPLMGITEPDASPDWTRTRSRYQVRTPFGVIALLGFIIFNLTLGGTLALIPIGRLVENAVCHRYYDTAEPIDERQCKVDAVQTELAWLGALATAVDAIVGFLVSFPYGVLSDRIGRKPIFRISFASLLISGTWSMIVIVRWDVFPPRALLLSPLLTIFGGGVPVLSTVISSVIADVAKERTSAFLWLGVGTVLGAILGPAMAALMMERYTPWVPLLLTSCIFTPMVFLGTIFLPETCPPKPQTVSPITLRRSYHLNSFKASVAHAYDRLADSFSVLSNRSIIIVLAIFFVHKPLATVETQIVGQILTTRFGWSIGQLGYLFSARGLLVIVVLALLPAATALLTSRRVGRFRLSDFRKDFVLAQASLVVVVIGNLVTAGVSFEAIVTGQVIAVLGVGLGAFAKALVAHYVDTEHTSRMYALTGMVETAGAFFASPAIAWAFNRGVTLGGAWVGLPFYFVSLLCTAVFVALLFLRPPPPKAVPSQDEEVVDDGDGA